MGRCFILYPHRQAPCKACHRDRYPISTRADIVEAGWTIVSPILDVWKALPARTFPNYRAGTWGPREADELMKRDGRRWREIE